MTIFASSSCQLHISGAHWAGSAAGLRISTVSPQIGGFRMLWSIPQNLADMLICTDLHLLMAVFQQETRMEKSVGLSFL